MKILLIDNYDSFTYNLYHYISNFKKDVEVIRNDKINGKIVLKKKYDKTENKAKGMLKALSMANYFSKIKGKKVNDFSNR